MIKCPLCEGNNSTLIHKHIDKRFGKRLYFSCPTCFLIFLHPNSHLSPQEEKKRYDKHKNTKFDKEYIKFLHRLADPVKEKLEGTEVGLDYGAGPGPAMDVIFHQWSISVQNYDPYYFPLKELLAKKYDFILCSETVEHFYDPRKEFILFNQLLKKNAFLAIMTSLWDETIDFSQWWYVNDETHVSFYSHQTFFWISEWLDWKWEKRGKNIIFLIK